MFNKMFVVLVTSLSFGLSVAQANPAPDFIPPCQNPEMLPDNAQVPCGAILVFEEGTSKNERINIAKGNGTFVTFNYELSNAAAVIVPNKDALQNLHNDHTIKQIIPDRIVKTTKKPPHAGGGGDKNNEGQVIPSGVSHIGAVPGNLSVNGNGVGIAIVDTGLDLTNVDLRIGGMCFTAYSSCNDDNGHGTHVGGTAAALDNTTDVVGVASGATVYAVKVLDNRGSGSDSTVIAGLEWVAQNAQSANPEIKVVNMSLGRTGNVYDNPVLHQTVAHLVNDLAISIVVSAGNDARREISEMIPAAYSEVMAIASVTAAEGQNGGCSAAPPIIPADLVSFFTTDGYNVAISAPGEHFESVRRNCFLKSEGILSLKPGGGVTRKSGTSMAAPHVSGTIALMLEQDGNLTPQTIRNEILVNAMLRGTAPLDSPATSYTFDGVREGVISACQLLNEPCP